MCCTHAGLARARSAPSRPLSWASLGPGGDGALLFLPPSGLPPPVSHSLPGAWAQGDLLSSLLPSPQLINEFRRAWRFIRVITAQASGATPPPRGSGEINILSGSSLSPRAPSIKSNPAKAGGATAGARQEQLLGAGLAASGSKGALGDGTGFATGGKAAGPRGRGWRGRGKRRAFGLKAICNLRISRFNF